MNTGQTPVAGGHPLIPYPRRLPKLSQLTGNSSSHDVIWPSRSALTV